jgi:hypothetical protein
VWIFPILFSHDNGATDDENELERLMLEHFLNIMCCATLRSCRGQNSTVLDGKNMATPHVLYTGRAARLFMKMHHAGRIRDKSFVPRLAIQEDVGEHVLWDLRKKKTYKWASRLLPDFRYGPRPVKVEAIDPSAAPAPKKKKKSTIYRQKGRRLVMN